MTKHKHYFYKRVRYTDLDSTKVKLDLSCFNFARVLKNTLARTLLLLFLCLLTVLPLSSALFNDSENSNENKLNSSSLDLEFKSKFANFIPQNLTPGSVATQSALIANVGKLPFQYSQEVKLATPDAALCQALKLKVNYNWYDNLGVLHQMLKYNNLLKDFSIISDTDTMIPSSKTYYSNSDYGERQHWYQYELELPKDANPALGNQICGFEIIAKAWMPQFTYGQAFYDSETLNAQITTSSWAKVSGIKFHDKNSNGVKNDDEEVLADWKIYEAKELQKLTVKATGEAQTSSDLQADKIYLVRAKGYYQADSNLRADAKYASKSPYADWADTVPDFEGLGIQHLELFMNGSAQNWGTYNSDHEYWLTIKNMTNPLTFYINDIYPTNNTGQIEVTIFEVEKETTTNSEGKYEFDLSNLTEERVIAEEMKTDWVQTFPVKGVYPITTPAIYENYNFGNRYVEPQNIGKIVINEVYYDVDDDHGKETSSQNDEWIELYNPNDFAINLKNWTIQDNGPSHTISNSNRYIAAHGFAVIAKAAQTWTYWTIPDGVEKIQLGDQIGNGLANDGDRLILKNANGGLVDQISWGTDRTIHNPSISDVAEGHSIARSPLGFDTDQASDWVNLTTPNPGTNPHSHIQVSVSEEDNNLIVGFSNAYGFDSLEYTLTYSHLYVGTYIEEAIQGEKSKALDQDTLTLPPMYLGTCSSNGIVCTPHYNIKDLKINLIYNQGENILGESVINYNWQSQ
ncbi:lamin tail domain-containing protein [Candidatus Beckwithbacteria bacterium]|nr:lamin tail domain-containing protein [Candidatus Beckwithbacteria bacterium]